MDTVFKIIVRLFLFAGGCLMLYGSYSLLIDPDMSFWPKLLSVLFILILGIGTIIYAIWYNKLSAWEAKKDLQIEIRQKQKDRELSLETKIRALRKVEIMSSLVYLAFSVAIALFILVSKPEFESVVYQVVSWGFCIYFLGLAINPLLKKIVKRLGWEKISSLLESDVVTEEHTLRELQKAMAEHKDDGTIIVAVQAGDIRNALETYVNDNLMLGEDVKGTAQLWQLDYERFAITFPCGVRRHQLDELKHALKSECRDIRLWCPSKGTKRTRDTDPVSFQSRPDIDFSTVKKRGLYYGLLMS